jgi:hypothetical protein
MMSQNLKLNPEEKQYLLNALSNDYALWATVVMGHIVEDLPPYQREMYDSFAKGFDMSAYVCFRGSGKSTISKPIQVTHDLCFARHAYTMLISESEDQASADLISIQDEVFNNEVIQELFGNVRGLITNTEAMELSNGCYVRVKGVKGKARGYKWKNNRPNKLILDDFESEQNTENDELRDQVFKWIFRVIKFMGEPGNVKIQFFNTIVHPKSFMAQTESMSFFKPPRGFYMNIPAMYRNPEGNYESNWPVMFPIDTLLREREQFYSIGQGASWDQEMLNVPAVTGRCIFDTSKIVELEGARFDHRKNITWIEKDNKKIPVRVYMGFDPAGSVREDADDTCGVIIGIPPMKGNTDGLHDIVILDIINGKFDPSKQPDILFKAKEDFGFVHVTIETNAYQLALPSFCRQMMGAGRAPAFAIQEFKSSETKGNKFLKGLEPYVNGGHVSYVPACAKKIRMLKEQMDIFSTGSNRKRDDIIDALYLSLNSAYPASNYNVEDALEFDKKSAQVQPGYNWRTI